MNSQIAANHLRRLLAQRLESLQDAGVEQLPRLKAIELAIEDAATASASTATTTSGPAAKQQDSGDEAARREQLEQLEQQVRQCEKCPALVQSRTQTVFGVGSVRPRLCFFGEAPGRDEDQQGEPFVGAAGQLLNKIIEAMTLQRSDVYILNVLKCRPPQNRNPEPDEVANCRPYYERQLEILQPEFICCLGAYAARTLLDTEMSVGKLRGQFLRHGDAQVVVTYHPAYLLRNPAAKRSTWEDMQMLMREMGLEVKG